jgi:hypothetical protein
MKKFLTTTALAMTLAFPAAAIAQTSDTTAPANQPADTQSSEDGKTEMNTTAPDASGSAAGTTTAPAPAESTAQTSPTAPATGDTAAQTQARTDGPATFLEATDEGNILASSLIGMRVYATEAAVDENRAYPADARAEWDDIGEVNDVVLSWDGNVKGVVLGVGGFLGMGEKDIAVDMSSITRVRESDDADAWFLVVNSNKEALEAAPGYKPERAAQ